LTDQRDRSQAKPTRSGRKGFTKGISGNPAGRPPGSRNRATLLAQQLLDGQSEAVVQALLDKALKERDLGALKIIIDRLLPPRRGRPVQFDLPEIADAPGVVAAYNAVLHATAVGQLTPEEAVSVSGVIDRLRVAIELDDHEKRLRQIEEALRDDQAA